MPISDFDDSATDQLTRRSFFYTREPMFLVDFQATVLDANAASRELFRNDLAGLRGRPWHRIANLLRVDQDAAIPLSSSHGLFVDLIHDRRSPGVDTHELQVRAAECTYASTYFGTLKLRGTLLPRVDVDSGLCVGWIISLEPLTHSIIRELRDHIDRRLSREVMWEVYSVSYDHVLSQLSFYQEVVDRHCTALAGSEICEVLDLGAGTGIPTIRLLEMGKSLTAVEINHAMVRHLIMKLNAFRQPQLTLIEDTAEALPMLADAKFDGVNVLLAMFDMSDPFAALREAMRLLKPGGTIAITEPRECFDVENLMNAAASSLQQDGKMEALASDWKRIQVVAPLIRATIKEAKSAINSAIRGRHWHAESLLETLKDEGFTDLTFRPSHNGNCATIIGRKRR